MLAMSFPSAVGYKVVCLTMPKIEKNPNLSVFQHATPLLK